MENPSGLVFKLEDFSDVIEVQLSEEMRVILKPFLPTTRSEPYSNIARRLFEVWSHSGSTHKVRHHKPYIPARCVKQIGEYTGIPYEMLERSVVSARSGYGGGNTEVFFPQGFPVKPTEDHAWLLGIFFSSGGVGNRKRGRTRHPFGRAIRFCVSDPVMEKLVEIGNMIGDVPSIYDPNIRVRTGKIKRTGIGNRRRRRAKFHAVTVEILAKFGLPKYTVALKDKYGWDTRGKGRVYSLRNIGLKLPEWIQQNEKFMHAFVEGYINGQKGASWAYSKWASKPFRHYRVVECHVQVRASGMNKKQTFTFLKKIADHLQEHKIQGKIRPMTYPNSRLTYWLAYEIFKNDALCQLLEEFNILKPELRARLFLMKHKNLLLLRMLQNFDSLTTVIFGVLLEKPRSVEEISLLLRLRRSQVEKNLEKLRKQQLIEKSEDKILINTNKEKKKRLKSLQTERKKYREALQNAQDQFFMRCKNCGIFTDAQSQTCSNCGGKLVPVDRFKALSSLLKGRQIILSRELSGIGKSTMPKGGDKEWK